MAYSDQLESQVQFGDTKASLLIAGDAILLGIGGGLINLVLHETGQRLALNQASSVLVIGAFATSALLVLALALALWAARPARIHDERKEANLFLFSHIARLTPEAFAAGYNASSVAALIEQTLANIHGKACYAAAKFRRLKWAINATLLSLAVLSLTLLSSLILTLAV